MASQAKELPHPLRAGRRALDGVPEFTLLRDWEWDSGTDSWWLHGRIGVGIEGDEFVPPSTDWYVKASPMYPWGEVVFYPATTGGLKHTFWHQSYNGGDPGDSKWRRGRLCVDTGVHALGRAGYDIEPFNQHERLAWHVRRVVEWLREAAAGTLARAGDPFELPDYRQGEQATLAFNEKTEDLAKWSEPSKSVGLAEVVAVPKAAETEYIARFWMLNGTPVLDVTWGTFLGESEEARPAALWIRLKSVPFLEPWQAPMTWGELRRACRTQGIDFDALVRRGAEKIRDGSSHPLLLGFPIPETVDGSPTRMHWLAAKLPPLTVRAPNGFRSTNDKGQWEWDRRRILRDNASIDWIRTENWSMEELSARGRLPASLTDRTVALIGAGALGSVMAELLVRAGVTDLTVCDGDDLEAGNLARHTLSLESVGVNKAEALARRLNASSPHAQVSALGTGLGAFGEHHEKWLASADLVLDCTGSDEALARLAEVELPEHTTFVSASLGLFARRMFVFSSSGPRFPLDRYMESVRPWLERELVEHPGTELPREGIGCWHPLFPARIDDIWLMAAAATKSIEAVVSSPSETATFRVIEQVQDGDGFTGLRTTTA